MSISTTGLKAPPEEFGQNPVLFSWSETEMTQNVNIDEWAVVLYSTAVLYRTALKAILLY